MKKSKFLQNVLSLLIGSFFVKILSVWIRILLGRSLGTSGMGYYSLIMPTYALMVNLSYFAIPTTISKIISDGKRSTSEVISSGVILTLIVNFIFMFFFLVSAPFIARVLLHEEKITYLLIACALSMPFMGLACVLKGYYFGKQRMAINSVSNVVEQLIRILFLLFFMPIFLQKSVLEGLFYYLLVSVLTESASILTFLILLPKGCIIRIKEIQFHKGMVSSLFYDSLPIVMSRLIGNLTYFLEPIVLSNAFLLRGDSSFLDSYGVLNGFSISMLLMPTFIVGALATSLIPEVTRRMNQNPTSVRRFLISTFALCFLLGLFFTVGICFFRETLLSLFYRNTDGSYYLYLVSFVIPFYYLEMPLISVLQAMNLQKDVFSIELFVNVLRLILQFVLAYLYGIFGVIYTLWVSVPLFVILLLLLLKKKGIPSI